MKNVLGVINFEDDASIIDGLGEYRPTPAIAFMGRYRVIDFILSNMTNSGINNVRVFCKEKPRNLFEHLGDGSLYGINTKQGEMRVLFGEKPFSSPVYNTDVANFNLNLQYIEDSNTKYVLVAPSYYIYTMDFTAAFNKHVESGADITVLYKSTTEAKEKFLGCDVLTLDKEKRVTAIEKNKGNKKSATVSLEAYIMEKSLFIELVKSAAEISSLYWFKDMIREVLGEKKIVGYQVQGYVACLNSLQSYFKASMELRDHDIAEKLFQSNWPIYTKTNDSAPTRYTDKASVSNSVIANECTIAGKVEGSIIGRSVTICEGAEVKNCIIMTEAVIGKGAKLDHVVVDKYAIVNHIRKLEGTEEAPVYVKRRDRI